VSAAAGATPNGDLASPDDAARPARPRCYIASPLGFTAAGRHWYRDVYLPALAGLVEVVDPWSLTSPEEVAAAVREDREQQLCREIGARNTAALRTCTLLVALLDGQELDSGTVAELGYGAALGLTCLGLRTDLRRTGESGARVNLQVEAFVLESGGKIVATLGDLLAALRRVVRPAG
jgi:nucleoside 2-deoxyribosyltransferase